MFGGILGCHSLEGREVATNLQCGESRDAVKHPTTQRADLPTAKSYLNQSVNSENRVEKP